MKQAEFTRLKDIEDEKDMDDLEVGDFFLYGLNVIGQKQNKQPGQEISYYEVIAKDGAGHVSYAPVFDILEKDNTSKEE